MLKKFSFFVLFLFSSLHLPHSARGEELTVGISIPLTGPLAEYGGAVRNGLQFALEEEPSQFRHVRFIFDDNRYDSKTALSVFHKHKNSDAVSLFFIWGDTPSLAVAPLAEASKSPLVAVLTDPDSVREMTHVVRFISSRHQYAEALVKYLGEKQIKRIGLLYSQSPYNTNHMRSLKASLRSDQELTLIADHLPTDLDLKSSILKAKAGNFDMVGLYLHPRQIPVFFRHARSMQFSAPVFGADAFESKTVIEQSLGSMDGAVYPMNPVSPEFHQRYRERFGTDTQIVYAANAYEFAKTMAYLQPKLAADHSPSNILRQLQLISGRSGVLGNYSYRQSERDGQYFEFPIAIKQIRGNDWLTIKSSPDSTLLTSKQN